MIILLGLIMIVFYLREMLIERRLRMLKVRIETLKETWVTQKLNLL